MIKIIHLMKDCADEKGIPNIPFFVPLYLNISRNYNNLIILTRYNYKPKLKKELPKIKYIPGKLALIKEILSFRPNVIIIYHHFGSPITLLLLIICKILRIKTVTRPDFTEYGLPKLHKSPIKTFIDFLRYILFYLQLSLFDIIVGTTRYEIEVLERLKKRFRNKIIPWMTEYEICSDNKEEFILTVSRGWSDRRNLHTILRVFAEIVKERKYKLIVVGKFHEGTYYIPDENRWETGEEYKQKIMRLIEELNLEDYVEFVGVKLGKDLQELYRKAKIFYLPSKNETFGMVYVEAMASGTPIVAMKNSAVQYVVKDGVTGFLRNDEEGQKEAILRLLTDEKLYKEMQKNCLKEAEKYRWENVIKKWERLIKELVKGKDVC